MEAVNILSEVTYIALSLSFRRGLGRGFRFLKVYVFFYTILYIGIPTKFLHMGAFPLPFPKGTGDGGSVEIEWGLY